MKSRANDNEKGTDPMYGKVKAKTGKIVSGGAGLLVRASAVGGPSNLVAIGFQAALYEANNAVTRNNRKKIRIVK